MYDHTKKYTVADIVEADYRFVEKDPNETSYVQLIGDSPWNGTVIQYGSLKIIAPENDDNHDEATLSFSYRIIETPLNKEVLEEDKSFKNYLGAILERILTDALETGECKLGNDDSNDDTEELAAE